MAVNESRPAGVQSLHRALDLIEAISERGDTGVTELAAEMGLAVSTTHNLLRTLAMRNYLTAERGRYQLGPAIMVLGSRTDPSRALAPLIQPALEGLSNATGHSATATALVGRNAHLIGYTPGTDPVTVNQAQMMWRDPLALATGRVLVAHRPSTEWSEFIAAGRAEMPSWSVSEWSEEFARIVRTGFCVKRLAGERIGGKVTAVAVPVWSRNNAVSCSIGIAVPARLTRQRINTLLDDLWESTVALSHSLGCDDPPQPHPRMR